MAQDILAEVDLEGFTRALNLYQQVTSKTEAEIVNKKAVDICFKAAKHSKKAPLPAIDKYDPEKTGKSKAVRYRSRLHYALQAKKGARKGGGIRDKAVNSHKKRRSASGYSKAIWYYLAKDLGASLRGNFEGKIKTTKGTRAKPNNPVATIEAKFLQQDHVSAVMLDALQKGVNEVALDMEGHALKELQKVADRFQG